MISHFQFRWHKRSMDDGTIRIHAALQACRNGKSQLVGILLLTEEEWQELIRGCEQIGIEVVHVAEPALST